MCRVGLFLSSLAQPDIAIEQKYFSVMLGKHETSCLWVQLVPD